MRPGKFLLPVVVFIGQAALGATDVVDAQTPPATTTPALRAEPIPPQVDATFKAWDADGNGALSIGEFRTGYAGLRQAGENQARLRQQFSTIDGDKNGAIDATEYGNLLLIKNAGAAAPPLSTFDANKNQRLELGEYMALVRRMAARQTATPGRTP